MLSVNAESLAAFKALSRQITGGVHIYKDSTLSDTLLPTETLSKIVIERTAPQGKFFGFAVIQKLTFEVIGSYPIAKGTRVKPYINAVGSSVPEQPFFYVDAANVDETTNTTTVVAYDIIGKSQETVIKDLSFTYPLTIGEFATQVVDAFGGIINANFTASFTISESPNFTGRETLHEVLAAIAEATGTVCYVCNNNVVKFRELSNTVVDNITTADYFNLSSEANVLLTKIISATDLGDNVDFGDDGGASQILWDNPFIVLRTDIATLLTNLAKVVIKGLNINPINLNWRGTPCYEIGDCINIRTVKGEVAQVYYFNDTLTYNGGLNSVWTWELGTGENPSSNPTSLGAALNQTFARVDKVNKQITLLVEEVEENTKTVAEIKQTSEEINMTVSQLKDNIDDELKDVTDDINLLKKKAELAVTADEVNIQITEALDKGVSSVTTTTGFEFGADGLNISKTGSEMSTLITEDGMTVNKDNEEMLKANNEGVVARNLHANTYLFIGEHSRLEDYETLGKMRTGCFWVGETND